MDSCLLLTRWMKMWDLLKSTDNRWILFVLCSSDGIFANINECVVGGQWTHIKAGATGLASRLDCRQNYTVNWRVSSSLEPQLLHDSGLLCGERRAPPCGGQRGVDQFAHLLPGLGSFAGLARGPGCCSVLGAAAQLLHAAAGWRLAVTVHHWRDNGRRSRYTATQCTTIQVWHVESLSLSKSECIVLHLVTVMSYCEYAIAWFGVSVCLLVFYSAENTVFNLFIQP